MRKMIWTHGLLALNLMLMPVLAGCMERNSGGSSVTSHLELVKIKMALWDSKADLDFWTKKVKEYTALHPNVSIVIEKVPDNNGQYLRIRLAANDLPDVFFLKSSQFQFYKQKLLELNDLEVTRSNKYPTILEGQVLGLPLVSFSEFVYYHPSIFKELNLEVPQTMPEFMDVMAKIKASRKYTPLSIGGKDNWTFYPLSEYGPHILSENVNYLANIAKNPEPFGIGSTFYHISEIMKEIADNQYAGADALSLSFDQSTQQFEEKEAAMIALGQWYYPSYMEKVKTDEDLGIFPLPFRQSEHEELYAMTLTDMNVTISKNSKNIEESKALLNWMFSNEVYEDYINNVQQFSTVYGITSNLPFFNKWTKVHPYEEFPYEGMDAVYAKVSSTSQYDPKQVTQDIFGGESVDTVMKELNNNWKEAVELIQ